MLLQGSYPIAFSGESPQLADAQLLLGCARLDPNPQKWLAGRWEGFLVDIVWDEDGEMVRLPPRPAAWSPPDPKRHSHKYALHSAC